MRIILLFTAFLLFGITKGIAQQKSKVELLSSNYIKSDINIQGGARRLIGNVKFKQDSTIMECDSAYFYADKNMFDAFSHVHLYKLGDSDVDVQSDFLRHNGDLKMAHFRKNVVLRDKEVIMRTDSLDYDTRNDIGYYLYGAQIEDSATTLTSVKGHYYHHERNIYFKDEVVINHNFDEFKLYSDTVKYNTISEIAYFFGPTELFNDTNYMYAEYGWYDTRLDQGFFRKNALYTNPKQSLEADTIFVDRKKEYGKAYSNIVATDTAQQLVIKGNYLELRQDKQYVFVTDSAVLISIMEEDTIYIHADTLMAYNVLDTMKVTHISLIDSSNVIVDSAYEYREFNAFHHVKIFKSDFQSKCDSLFFSMKDSIAEFHGDPVMWAESSQITANYIEGFIVDKKLDRFKLYETGLIISQQDSQYYNQIKGKQVIGYFKDNKLFRIDVEGSSETIYFPTDKGEVIGVNKANSKNISIYMRNNEVKRINYRADPKSTLYPLEELGPKDLRMREFVWLDAFRPKTPEGIFIWEAVSANDN